VHNPSPCHSFSKSLSDASLIFAVTASISNLGSSMKKKGGKKKEGRAGALRVKANAWKGGP